MNLFSVNQGNILNLFNIKKPMFYLYLHIPFSPGERGVIIYHFSASESAS